MIRMARPLERLKMRGPSEYYADGNRGGIISLQDLYEYAAQEVTRAAALGGEPAPSQGLEGYLTEMRRVGNEVPPRPRRTPSDSYQPSNPVGDAIRVEDLILQHRPSPHFFPRATMHLRNLTLPTPRQTAVSRQRPYVRPGTNTHGL
jgi:hypothetical protein